MDRGFMNMEGGFKDSREIKSSTVDRGNMRSFLLLPPQKESVVAQLCT